MLDFALEDFLLLKNDFIALKDEVALHTMRYLAQPVFRILPS
jgi:hypothetical protein